MAPCDEVDGEGGAVAEASGDVDAEVDDVRGRLDGHAAEAERCEGLIHGLRKGRWAGGVARMVA